MYTTFDSTNAAKPTEVATIYPLIKFYEFLLQTNLSLKVYLLIYSAIREPQTAAINGTEAAIPIWENCIPRSSPRYAEPCKIKV